jgi:hypothetical protein
MNANEMLETLADGHVTVHCTDDASCDCRICHEIHAGQRDAEAADGVMRAHLQATAYDIMPDGGYRFAGDFYWQGILDIVGIRS